MGPSKGISKYRFIYEVSVFVYIGIGKVKINSISVLELNILYRYR